MARTQISYKIHHPKALKNIAGEVNSICGTTRVIPLVVPLLNLPSPPDGRGPSSPHYESQAPSLDRLEPCRERLAHDEERLDSKGERLAHDEERLHKERLGGSLDRLGPSTSRTQGSKLRFRRRRPLYMLHGGPLGVA